MPNKNSSKSKKPRFNKKKAKKQEENLDNLEDDEHLFFDQDFIAPEGEDLDEPDEEDIQKLYEQDPEEDIDDDMGFDEEYDIPEGDYEGDIITDDIEPERISESKKIVITKERLDMITSKTEENSKRGLKMFLKVFSSAINQGTEDEDDDIKKRHMPVEFIVEEGEIYNEVINFAMERIPYFLQNFINNNGGLDQEGKLSRDGLILTNIYFSSLVKLIERTHDKNILIYFLQHSVLSLKILFLNKKYYVKFLKKMIEVWSQHESNVVKFKAFLNLRYICHENKLQNLEKFLRTIYLALIKNAKHITWLNHEQVTFMINYNFKVELVGFNKDIAYVIGFSYLREIAVHLKNCMKERTKENVHKIYNWQFLNIIRIWFATIGAYPSLDDLGRLAHPLIEISFGILKFYPHPRYAPLRLHLIDYLDEFSYKSNIYIPTMHILFEIMKEANVNKKRDKTFTKAYDFSINVKVQKMYLKANLYYNELFQQALTRLNHSFANLALFVSFPESIIIAKNVLRKFIKEVRSKELRDEMKKSIDLLDKNSKTYLEKRAEFKMVENKEIQSLTLKLASKGFRGLSLMKLSTKLRKENEEYIKQNILSEQEKFYAEGKEDEEAEGEEIEYEGEEEDIEEGDEDEEGDFDEEEYDDEE